MKAAARMAVLIALWLLPAAVRAQGVVEGVVTDAIDGGTIPDALVQIIGTASATHSSPHGRYRLNSTVVGVARIRAVRVGYVADTLEVTLAPLAVATLDIRLRPAPVLLNQIVVMATGQPARQRASGAAVARILPDSLPSVSIQTFSDLITARTAGLTVLHSGGSTGGGARVRLRGSNSMTLSNEPLYLLDGVRLDNNPTTFPFATPSTPAFAFGDESPSRLDEIDAEFVQAVDVIKGPAAAALYGTAAANGVIQLQTRAGTPGPARWTAYIEAGGIAHPTAFPANYGLWTRSLPPPPGQEQVGSGLCTLVDVEDGTCVADSVARYNPLMQASPFRTGYRSKVGVSVGGGRPGLTYFVGGNGEYEGGVNRANDLGRVSLRANLTGRWKTLEASLSSGYLHRDLGVPQNGFTYLGPIPDGMTGYPFRQSVDGDGHPTYGYYPVGPDQLRGVNYSQRTDHLIGATTATWRPTSWLTLTGVTGFDEIYQLDSGLVPQDQVFFPLYRHGLHENHDGRYQVVTANWSATAELPLSAAWRLAFAGGTQYSRKTSRETFSTDLADAADTSEQGAEQKILGAYASTQMGWRDRVFLTAAMRSDWSGAFDRSYPAIRYPALMGSWVISDEPFFPRSRWLTSLRLRAAYGRSGLLPGPTDHLTLLRPVTVPTGGRETSTVTVGQLGNPDLRPERISEYEGGFDAEVAGGRIGLQATYYNKRSQDALVLVPLAGSVGSAAGQLRNVGEVSNTGLELLLRGDPVSTPRLDWSVSLAMTGTRNRLISLGSGVSAIDLTFVQRLVPGYPLGGFWATPADSVVDRNQDGMIGHSEVFFDPDKPRRYVGSPFPTRSLAFTSSLDVRRRVRLWGQFDYEGGHRKYDFSERLRCQDGVAVCRPLSVITAPLADKENAALAYIEPDYRYGYIENASFLKWRELGLEWTLPAAWARWAHTGDVLLSLAVRNVATWTGYRGLDPESTRSQDNFIQVDYYTQPEVRYFIGRLTLDL